MPEGFEFPDIWWGGTGWWGQPAPLSIIDLVRGRTLNARTAALCWLLLENRTSFFVCAGPQRVGKTTTATALLAFLPRDAQLAFTNGQGEDFTFTATADPAATYIMVNELSNHIPAYLWGPPAARVFDLVEHGYALGGTLHADAPEEVMAYLQPPPVRLAPQRLARTVPLLIFLRAFIKNSGGARSIERRVDRVQLLEPIAEGVYAHTLTAWDPASDQFSINREPAAWEALSQQTGMIGQQQHEELEERAGYLTALVEEGVSDFNEVRRRILDWS